MEQWHQVAAVIERYGQAAEDAALRAMDVVGNDVLAEAKDLCPVSPSNQFIKGADGGQIQNPHWTGHPGALRDSGTTDPAERVGDELVKVFKFTGTVSPSGQNIAAIVHEQTAVRHGAALQAAFPYLRGINPTGQAKFLAIPLLRRRRSAVVQIAQAVEAVRLG